MTGIQIYIRPDGGAIKDELGCADYSDPKLAALDAIKTLSDYLIKQHKEEGK